MKHFIIVKFKDNVRKDNLVNPIKNLFDKALDIDGIDTINIYLSNTELSNRHDLMIEMNLTLEALNIFDNSYIHKTWKDGFGKYIMSKIIFDCD